MTYRRHNKYNARKVKLDGYTFDSQAESNRYLSLKTLQRVGEISDLVVHPVFVLLDPFDDRDGKRWRAIKYEADFSYMQDGQKYVEDVKGVETAVFKLKRKMFLRRYPEIIFIVVK